MRTLRCNLDLFKSTEQKLRWDEDVDGTNFAIYIPKWRVPEPTPPMISVNIVDPDQQLSPDQEIQLSTAGLTDDQIREIDAWPPVTRTVEENPDLPIIAAVEFDRIHTQTVRYKPVGEPDRWELGQPYIPKSILSSDYPKRLILLVMWKH